jgi:hypothetical protein
MSTVKWKDYVFSCKKERKRDSERERERLREENTKDRKVKTKADCPPTACKHTPFCPPKFRPKQATSHKNLNSSLGQHTYRFP